MCSFVCDRYEEADLDDVQKLQKEHQQMAALLQVAEQEGIIDVYLAMVTEFEYCTRDEDFFTDRCDEEVTHSDTTVDHWRSLDGRNPGWKKGQLNQYSHDSDCILQVGNSA